MSIAVEALSCCRTRRTPCGRVANWTATYGYARSEIPYHLLIDLDPGVSRITLYSIPDGASGGHLHQDTWEFGETVVLPDPFGLEIPTAAWRPWA